MIVTIWGVEYVPAGTEKLGAGTGPIGVLTAVTSTITKMDWEMLPFVAVIVRGRTWANETAAPVTETVSVDEPAPVIVAGLKLPVAQVCTVPLALHVSTGMDKVTGESKPSAASTLTVTVPVVIAGVPAPMAPMLIGFGDATNSNDGSGAGAIGA